MTWHLGLVTPAEHYAAVEQTDGARRSFLGPVHLGRERAGS